MHKEEFINYIAQHNNITKTQADTIITIFTKAVTSAIADGKEISLIGFGQFTINNVAARKGQNPKTGQPINIDAYKQVRFKPGQTLKDAANNKLKTPAKK